MWSVLSFPNALCLVLFCVLVTQLMSRDHTHSPGHAPASHAQQDLQDIFCRLPQSYRPEDSQKCSSTQQLFSLLGNACSLDRRAPEESLFNETDDADLARADESGGVTADEAGEEDAVTSSLVDWLVVGLLVCSAAASLAEWCRERNRHVVAVDQRVGGGGGAEPGGGDRRYSLADLTVNRHSRRSDSQHQLEAIRQGSGSKPPLLRRSSFPAQTPEGRSRPPPQRQQSVPAVRRPSIGGADDEDRRRVRLIRRH